MTGEQTNGLLAQLRGLVLAAADADRSDADLLTRYLSNRDEAAFAALVHRHGGLVWGVCRRLLSRVPDAEDAFQATFLVLARKAGNIRQHGSIASWLHGVASRVARKLRADIARREAPAAPQSSVSSDDPAAEVSWREVRTVLDEELGRLPEKYRAPLLLCYLEGLTQDEAARQLGWQPGVLRGRLDRGRLRLRGRLTQRGVVLSTALLGAFVGPPLARAAPAPLAIAAARAASDGPVSSTVIALTDGVLKAMFVTKLKTLAALLLIVCVGGLSFGLLSGPLAAQDRTSTGAATTKPPAGDPFGPQSTGPPGSSATATGGFNPLAPPSATGSSSGGGFAPPGADSAPARGGFVPTGGVQPPSLERRVAELEKQVADLRKQMERLQPGPARSGAGQGSRGTGAGSANEATTDDNLVMQAFSLKHIEAAEAARILADTFKAKRISIGVQSATNAVMIRATQQDQRAIEVVLTRLDVAPKTDPVAPQFKIFHLKNMDGAKMSGVLNEMYKGTSVRVASTDEKIVIFHAKPEQLTEIMRVIEALDNDPPKPRGKPSTPMGGGGGSRP